MNKIALTVTSAVLAAMVGCTKSESQTTAPETGETVDQTEGAPEEVAEFATAQRLEGWDGVNNMFGDGSMFFAGQPDEASFKRLANESGVVTVVNIRQAREIESLSFDEKAVVEGLEMAYVHIPVSTASFSAEDVAIFASAVDASDGPVLLHCASSNRVGAMWAAYLATETGMEVNEAIELGRAAGMRSELLVEAVHRVTGTGAAEVGDGGGGG